MTLILSVIRDACRQLGHRKGSAPCGITIACCISLLQFVPWRLFDRLVDEHGADTRVRRLTTQEPADCAHLCAAFGRPEPARDRASHGQPCSTRLYHLGAAAPARSTLADANAQAPGTAVCRPVRRARSRKPSPGLRRATREAIHLVDASSIRPHRASRAPGPTITAHGALVPSCTSTSIRRRRHARPISPSRRRASTTSAWPTPCRSRRGATYVFDLGYYDFSWWAKLARGGLPDRHAAQDAYPPAPFWRPAPWPQAGRCVIADRIVAIDCTSQIGARRTSSARQASPCARWSSRSTAAAPCGSSPTICKRPRSASVNSTRRAGRSSCSSAGSSSTLKIKPLPRHQRERRQDPDRRRPDRLPHPQDGPPRQDLPSPACSPSRGSSAPTSCIADPSTISRPRHPRSAPTHARPNSPYAKPDSRGRRIFFINSILDAGANLANFAMTLPAFGVYIHWPFCASKCPYCDFNSHVRAGGVDEARFLPRI